MGVGFLLSSVPLLIGQWVGIIGLGKANRNAAWWCMMIGILGTTLGIISFSVFLWLPQTGFRALSFGSSILSRLGSLLFAIGFTIHGLQASKIHQRITELETIAAAQGEELNRLRAS